jgi:hypothetical protein
MSANLGPLSILLLLVLLGSVHGIVYDYNDVNVPSQSILESTHGLYGASNGDSAYVNLRMSLILHTDMLDNVRGEDIDVALIRRDVAQAKSKAGGAAKVLYQCTNGVLTLDETQLLPVVSTSQHKVNQIKMTPNVPTTMSIHFPITHDGQYTLLFARCSRSSFDVFINGKVEWLSQYGQLPGEYLKLLPFYALITVIYFIAAVVWFLRLHQFKGQTIRLQELIYWVIVFNAVESLLCFWNYYTANKTGRHLNVGPIFEASELCRVVSDTVCRTFILLLCLGYGVIHKSITQVQWIKVGTFSSVYFFLKMCDHLTRVTPASVSNILVVMDVMLLVWFFYGLGQAERYLTEEVTPTTNSELKLEMYQSTRFLLIVFIFVTILCFVGLHSAYDIWPWTWEWIRHSFEDCIIFLVVFYLSIAWVPSEDSQLYAPLEVEMSELKMEDEEDQ